MRPIPQFVHATRMAEIDWIDFIEVSAEEVAARMEYRVVTRVDGGRYVIGVYALDPDPAQQGETPGRQTALTIAKVEESGIRLHTAHLSPDETTHRPGTSGDHPAAHSGRPDSWRLAGGSHHLGRSTSARAGTGERGDLLPAFLSHLPASPARTSHVLPNRRN